MRFISYRLFPLLVTASLAALVANGCGGTTPSNDAKNDAKNDGKIDAGTGGKTGTGGSGGKTGTGGSGGSGGGNGDTASDPGVDHADTASGDADVKPDLAPDAVDVSPDTGDVVQDLAADAGTDADAPAETAQETTPETTSETAPESAPEAAAETATETAPDTTPDSATLTAIAPCNTAGDYTTATAIGFPANGSDPQQYAPACVKVAKNATVTFSGGFTTHPLQPRNPVPAGATSGNPIVLTSGNQASAAFQFPNPGFFPFECGNHPGTMMGVIWVTE